MIGWGSRRCHDGSGLLPDKAQPPIRGEGRARPPGTRLWSYISSNRAQRLCGKEEVGLEGSIGILDFCAFYKPSTFPPYKLTKKGTKNTSESPGV